MARERTDFATRPPLELPASAVVRDIEKAVRPILPDHLYLHSLRSYFLASAYAAKRRIPHDREGLCIAVLCHDLGLCPPYLDKSRPFTFGSAEAMLEHLAGHDVEEAKIEALRDAVVYHFQMFPKWSKGNEAGLLQIGTYMDVLGLRRWKIRAAASEIRSAYPSPGATLAFFKLVLGSLGSASSGLGLLCPTIAERRRRR